MYTPGKYFTLKRHGQSTCVRISYFHHDLSLLQVADLLAISILYSCQHPFFTKRPEFEPEKMLCFMVPDLAVFVCFEKKLLDIVKVTHLLNFFLEIKNAKNRHFRNSDHQKTQITYSICS